MKSIVSLSLVSCLLLTLSTGCQNEKSEEAASPKRIYPLGNAPGVKGVIVNTEQAEPGYTLIAPFTDPQAYLIDIEGTIVKKWRVTHRPGFTAYLLEDGCFLRTTCRAPVTFSAARGATGGIQKLDWDGNVVWDYRLPPEMGIAHHDLEVLPNGNILMLAWVMKTEADLIATGRDPAKIENRPPQFDSLNGSETLNEQAKQTRLLSEVILEIEPVGEDDAKIVWKWDAWDHLVQAFDETKPNYGQPTDRPERIDLNYCGASKFDWLHINSLDYNAELGQIMVSCRSFNEVWIIDHQTSMEEAASSSGGRYGKGGDLLYRWGNPFSYGMGTPDSQMLFSQHDAQWIPQGYPGGGHVLLFNNGDLPHAGKRDFSSVDEFVLPIDDSGVYSKPVAAAYPPQELFWNFHHRQARSERISGAQRMKNGNTLICYGQMGLVLEVDSQGKIVWEFINYLEKPPEAESPATTKSSASAEDKQTEPSQTAKRPGALSGTALNRAERYPLNFPGFQGRTFSAE